MGSGLYNLLFSENIEQLNIEEEIREAFPLIARLSGSNCGVLILKSKTSDSFMEYASFGYGEEGFFYNFMARGKGFLKKFQKQICLLFSLPETMKCIGIILIMQ